MKKRKYLTISEGFTSFDARPIFATADAQVIEATVKEIHKRLAGNTVNQETAAKKQVAKEQRHG